MPNPNRRILISSPLNLANPSSGGQQRSVATIASLQSEFETLTILPRVFKGDKQQVVTGIGATSRLPAIAAASDQLLHRVAPLARMHRNPILRQAYSRLVASVNPAIVHCEFLTHAALVESVCRERRVPFVLSEHNVEFQRLVATGELPVRVQPKLRSLELRTCNLARAVVVVSDLDRERLVNAGVTSDIIVAPNGVRTSLFDDARTRRASTRRQLGVAESDAVIVFHGPATYPPNREAIALLLSEVLPSLRKRIPATLLLFGRGTEAYASSSVVALGEVEMTRIPHLLGAADVAVVPLLEGSGTRLKIAEYLAAGLPVVSTPIGAEGVSASDDMVLRKPVSEIAEATEEVASQHWPESRHRELALWARRNLDWSVTLRPLLAYYKRALGV